MKNILLALLSLLLFSCLSNSETNQETDLLLLSENELDESENISMEIPENYNEAMELYHQALTLFSQDSLDEAYSAFLRVDQFIDKNMEYETYFDHRNRGFSYSQVVLDYQEIEGQSPQWVHKILVLYITKTDIKGSTPLNEVLDSEIITQAERSQDICRRMVEVCSEGSLTLEFDSLSINSSVTDIGVVNQSGEWEISPERIWNSLTPYPSEEMLLGINQYDSILIYWNDGNIKTESGYGGRAYGGAIRIPIVQDQLIGPVRGRLILSASLTDRPGTLFHEWFHSLERMYHITPIHGFRENIRSAFPQWEGTGEMDYYNFHFRNIIQNGGFENLLINKNQPNMLEGSLNELLERNQDIRSYILLKELGIEAFQIKNFQEALNYMEIAYDKSPHDPDICYWLGVIYYNLNRRDKENALYWMDLALSYAPNSGKILEYKAFLDN